MRRLALLALVIGCDPKPATYAPLRTPPARMADLVLVGGDIWTMDPAKPHAQAVAIAGGQIVAVGTDAEVKDYVAPRTRVIELHGHAVTPGLVDAHCHLYGLGADLENVNVRGMATEADAAKQMATGVVDLSRNTGQWVTGRGWDQNKWPGAKFPTHASLDAVVSDRPVVVTRIDGHAIWVNAAAMKAAGIDRKTPDPAGGRIERDAKGDPTGVFVDNAVDLIEKVIPKPTAEQRTARIEAAIAKALPTGITGVHEMGIEDETADAYRALDAKHPLPLRVYAFLLGDPQKLDRLKAPPAPGSGHFEMRGVKFFADGALGSRGARLYADYDDDRGNRGLWVTKPDALKAAVTAATASGWQVAVHAIGDEAVGSVLDAFAGHEDRRLRVEHLQIVAPKDVERVVSTHAIASMQPTHATSDMPWAEARIGAERVKGAYAWRTMLDKHVPLAFGSDFPVEDVGPLLGVYAAVTRQDEHGKPDGGWHPEQKLTLDEALAAFTRGAAFAEFAEAHRGVIAVGMTADLTGYDRELAADRTLLDTHAAFTIVDGVVRWEAGK